MCSVFISNWMRRDKSKAQKKRVNIRSKFKLAFRYRNDNVSGVSDASYSYGSYVAIANWLTLHAAIEDAAAALDERDDESDEV